MDELQWETLQLLDDILGIKLDENLKQPFLKFHDYITNPEPEFLTTWKKDERLNNWYNKICNTILGDVQNAYACVLYSYVNLENLEKNAHNFIMERKFIETLKKGQGIGVGNTLRWDFEYQSFILAYRRLLDYLAIGISAYFKNNFNSFRTLKDNLKKLNKPVETENIILTIEKYLPLFDFVMSDGNRKSIRDSITHKEYATVGVLNINSKGIVLVGGPENLNLHGKEIVTLAEIQMIRIENLRNCISELIENYIQLMRQNET